jgi:hypothetical protein
MAIYFLDHFRKHIRKQLTLQPRTGMTRIIDLAEVNVLIVDLKGSTK